MLNPNCSEAIMRLRIDMLKGEEIQTLTNEMEKMEENDWWADTYWKRLKIFGIDAIEINGSAPFNSRDNITTKLGKLPFFKKLVIEDEEA